MKVWEKIAELAKGQEELRGKEDVASWMHITKTTPCDMDDDFKELGNISQELCEGHNCYECLDEYLEREIKNIHNLKTLPAYFKEVKSGNKTFEVRKNDRGFEVGDILVLQEYCNVTNKFTGNKIVKEISYILDDSNYCKDRYIVMGLKEVS